MIIAKYADHLPLYLQEQIFGCAGFAISCSAPVSWVGTCGEQLQPLVDALRKVVFEQNVVYVDETPVQMLPRGESLTTTAPISSVVYDFIPG